MILIKNKREIGLIRTAGQRLARLMIQLENVVQAGVSTWDIEQYISQYLQEQELKAECKGYGGYPCVSCISVNDVVVHGIPRKDVVLKNGDFVKVDVVGSFNGFCADMARGFFVGNCDSLVVRLDKIARESFFAGFEKIKPGVRLSDVSHAIESYVVKNNFYVVREFAGHGIGRKIHEDPEIPNFGKPGNGPILREGMVLAVEPMITSQPCRVVIEADGWTARTSNGALAAHFENTVVVTSVGAEILTE